MVHVAATRQRVTRMTLAANQSGNSFNSLPTPVTDITLLSYGATQATIAFIDPTPTQMVPLAAPIYYAVQGKIAGTSSWSRVALSTGPTDSQSGKQSSPTRIVQIDGLTPATDYLLRVVSHNTRGAVTSLALCGVTTRVAKA